MAIAYTFDQSENLVFAEAQGAISIQELINYKEIVLNDYNIKNGFIEIVDLSKVTDLEITYSSAEKLTRNWDKWKQKSHIGSIMYAPTDLTYGILRMMQNLINTEPGSEGTPHLVTKNKGDIPKLIKSIRA